MDKGSKILLWVFVLLTSISVAALYHKSFVTESYEQTYSDDYYSEDSGGDEGTEESINSTEESLQIEDGANSEVNE